MAIDFWSLWSLVIRQQLWPSLNHCLTIGMRTSTWQGRSRHRPAFGTVGRSHLLLGCSSEHSNGHWFDIWHVSDILYYVLPPVLHPSPRRRQYPPAPIIAQWRRGCDRTVRASQLFSTEARPTNSFIRGFILRLGRYARDLTYLGRQQSISCHSQPLCCVITSSRSLFRTNHMDWCYLLISWSTLNEIPQRLEAWTSAFWGISFQRIY